MLQEVATFNEFQNEAWRTCYQLPRRRTNARLSRTDVIVIILVEHFLEFTYVGMFEILHDGDLSCEGGPP